jgi:hypothetical protein
MTKLRAILDVAAAAALVLGSTNAAEDIGHDAQADPVGSVAAGIARAKAQNSSFWSSPFLVFIDQWKSRG